MGEKRGGGRRGMFAEKGLYHQTPLWANLLDAPPPAAQAEALANNPLFPENKNQLANVKVKSKVSWISKQPSRASQPSKPQVESTALSNCTLPLCLESPAISGRVESIRGHLLWKRCYHWGCNLCKEILWLEMIKLESTMQGFLQHGPPSGVLTFIYIKIKSVKIWCIWFGIWKKKN